MKYDTLYADLFLDHFERFTLKERRIIERKIELLINNPDHPSLRTQSLHRFEDFYESSVSMGIRVIWELDEDTIILHDVGRHDILKKYG